MPQAQRCRHNSPAAVGYSPFAGARYFGNKFVSVKATQDSANLGALGRHPVVLAPMEQVFPKGIDQVGISFEDPRPVTAGEAICKFLCAFPIFHMDENVIVLD